MKAPLKKTELKTRIVNHATLGHLFFRPSAHFPYSTSANCFVCFIPGIALPGKSFCFSVHVSSVGISDWRRLWLLRCGLFCASTSFGVEVPEGCEDGGVDTGGGSKCESLGSLHQNISLLKKARNSISVQTYFCIFSAISFKRIYSPSGSSTSRSSQACAVRDMASRFNWLPVWA